LDAAADGDEVLLADGTFTGVGNQDLRYVGKNVTVRSASGIASACVLDLQTTPGGPFARFEVADGLGAELRDVTVTSSQGVSPLLHISGSPTIDGVVFDGFSRTAIVSNNASPIVRNSVFTNGGTPTVDCNGGSPTISDCLFEANQMINSSGPLDLVGVTGAVVERCTFRNNIHVPNSDVVIVHCGAGSAAFTDCEITGNPGIAFGAHAGYATMNVTLERCLLRDNNSGIQAGTFNSSNPSSFTVRDCDVMDNGGPAFGLHGNVDALVENARFDGNRWGVTASTYGSVTGRSLTVRDTRITNSERDGIYAGYPTIELERCHILGSGDHGVTLYVSGSGPGSATVRSCLIAGSGEAGMRINQWDAVLVERTTVTANAAEPGAVGVRLDYDAHATFRNSVVWGNCAGDGTQVHVEPGCTAEFECSDLDPTAVTGAGALVLTDVITQDPLFCDAAACGSIPSAEGIYTLLAGSPVLLQPCGPMGATGSGCAIATGAATMESSSWARIKARYR
ncbi:right-handed parallel beta-helix repeat-containing protein, partial [bacterium]|nr:right-handed parallel beta-helix repeat-containing protein [bacterium]